MSYGRGSMRRSRKRWQARGRAYSGGLPARQRAWWRSGNVQVGLSMGSPRAEHSLVSGAGLLPSPAVELAMNDRRAAKLERILIKLTVAVVDALAAQLLRYWFGVRLQEATDAGVNVAIGDAPALNIVDTGDRRESWLWRDSRAVVSGTSGADVVPVLDLGGSPMISLDFTPRRPLNVRQLLVFQHQWGVAIDGSAPNATLYGSLDVQALVSWNST